jgi:O-antigen/teichoic acid export membrane protein
MKLAKISESPLLQNDWAVSVISHLRKPLYRNGYALMLNAVTTSFLGILYWVIAARFYTTEAVGINSTTISTMTFLSTAARLYLDGALIRFLPRSGEKATRLIKYSYLIGGVASVILGAVFLLGLNLWAPALGFLRGSASISLSFLVATVASCIFTEQDGAMIGLRQAHWVPVENILFAAAKIVMLVVLAKLLPQYGIYASWVLPLIISLLPVNLLIFLKLLPKHNRENVEPEAGIGPKEIFHYAGGLYAGYIFSAASLRLLPLIVLQVVGSHAAAYFTLPWMIVTSLQLVIPSMYGSLTVEASRDQSKLVKYSRQAFSQTARILVPLVLFLFAVGPYLLRLFGKNYALEANTLLRLLCLAILPQIMTGLYFGIARIHRSVGGVVKVHASLFVMNITLSYVLMEKFGITGVGIAWLTSQLVIALILYFTQLRPILWSKKAETLA